MPLSLDNQSAEEFTSSSDSITFSCRNFRLCWKTDEDGLLGVSDTGVSGIVVCESPKIEG
jgi:hypothetical protein